MILLNLALAAAAVTTPMEGGRQFSVNGRTFTGSDQSVCSITGEWSDGESFQYQAWDSCDKIRMKWVPPKASAETVEQVHGRNRTFIIPAGSEGFIISNDISAVHIFRNPLGEVEEILISD